ncbi:hypothetical protein BKA62DRAFT_413862 [Auriculariales sp. MPI-PUGE-AT-0066]|nr:hypothetical protein BKA62DRAFT_413862 [Auriculariales sp. MPI-PUGE-AT-0066]
MMIAPFVELPLNFTNWAPLPDTHGAHALRGQCFSSALSSHIDSEVVYALGAGVEYSLDFTALVPASWTAQSLTIRAIVDIEEAANDAYRMSATRPTASCLPIDLHWKFGPSSHGNLPRKQFVFNPAPYTSFVVISAMLLLRDERPQLTSFTRSTGLGFAQLTRRTAAGNADPPATPRVSKLIPVVVVPIIFLVLAVAGFALFVYLRRRRAWRAADEETEFTIPTPNNLSRKAATASTAPTASSATRTKLSSKTSPFEVDFSHI